jgi:hypothetical protein
MTLPDSTLKEMTAMPPVLRALLEAELAAGNSIAEIGHTFPAPPAGAYFLLTQPLLSRERVSGDGIDYYNRNNSNYSGEVTDSKRFFFLLEPPAPPPPEPNMDDIRAVHMPVDQIPYGEIRRVTELTKILRPSVARAERENVKDTSLVANFRRSMEIDYEKWHDGIGYDLTLIEGATPEERADIERIILARDARDWRDIEALAALDSAATRKALKGALQSSNSEVSIAVMRYAPKLVPESSRIRTLVTALRSAHFFSGLTEALGQVEDFHPPAIIAELFHGALERDKGVGVHFAAMLMFIHGKAECAFDWAQRPFFLRFNATQRDERETVFLELCEQIGAPAEPFAQKVHAAREKLVREEKKQAILAKTLVPIFEVEIDATRELLIYREPRRSATVTCTFDGEPRLRARTLSDWTSLTSKRTKPMTEEEKAETLHRIMDYCRNRHGLLTLKREDMP